MILMKINLAVIGDPVAHSLSPIIHTTVLNELGIDCGYEKIRIAKGGLSSFLSSDKCAEISGFNLTMPHKQDIIPHLDFIDADAQIFSSVNTVKIDGSRLLGYNTDGQGCLRAIENTGHNYIGKNIVILGAGGVASTVALKMASAGAASVSVLNRTLSGAQALARNVLDKTGANIVCGKLDIAEMTKQCQNCDILINCTPLGMEGIDFDFEDFSFLTVLPKDALVYDLIYKPEMTNLLKGASRLGLDTLNGLDMLIYQGLLADEIFLDTTLDFAYLKAKIQEQMKKI